MSNLFINELYVYLNVHQKHNVRSSIFSFLPAQNRVLLERLSYMEAQLKAAQEDSDRLRMEREGQRERLSELQVFLKEKEAEVRIIN